MYASRRIRKRAICEIRYSKLGLFEAGPRGCSESSEYFVPNRGENKLVSTLLFFYMCWNTAELQEEGIRIYMYIQKDTFLRDSSRSNLSREREQTRNTQQRDIRNAHTHTHSDIFVYTKVENCKICRYCKGKLLFFEITCGAFDARQQRL